jgi:RND family efflux transporter MFP subunit
MSNVELSLARPTVTDNRGGVRSPPNKRDSKQKSSHRIARFLITIGTVLVSILLAWATWEAYLGAPWTRDGQVRAYVVTMSSEVAGRVVELPVADNQFVHKGELLMTIDPTDYRIAVSLAEAAVQQAQANAQNLEREAKRRQELSTLSTSVEEKQSYESNALAARASYQQAVSNLDQARVNLDRTRILSPVDGYVTNLLTQIGDFATIGQRTIAIVDANSFWVDGYFEETNLEKIHEGDPAKIKLMGYSEIIHGHVGGLSRGINVPNAQPDQAGLASVNPIFTWVRLAQRVPVRIHIDQVPDGIRLVAGITATVQIDSERKIAVPSMRATSKSSPEHDLKNPGGSLSQSIK